MLLRPISERYIVASHYKTNTIQALFGIDPKIGLGSTFIPPELLQKLIAEEDLENSIEQLIADNQTRSPIPPIADDETPLTSEENPRTDHILQDLQNVQDGKPPSSIHEQDFSDNYNVMQEEQA